MDKDHRLDAPDNEALRTIEQIDDHSDLSTIYPHAHSDWEGVELLSRDEREKRREDEKLRISLSLRKWFVPIALLIPLPFVVSGILITLSANYLNLQSLGFMMLPMLIITGGILYATYRGFKYGYKIFYKHGVKAWPFILALLALLLASLNLVFRITEPLHTGEEAIDVLIISGAILSLSLVYSLILVFVWSSPRLSAGAKIIAVSIFALILLASTALLNFL